MNEEQLLAKMELIVRGAISVYESEGLDLRALSSRENRPDLTHALDAMTQALYWLESLLRQPAP